MREQSPREQAPVEALTELTPWETQVMGRAFQDLLDGQTEYDPQEEEWAQAWASLAVEPPEFDQHGDPSPLNLPERLAERYIEVENLHYVVDVYLGGIAADIRRGKRLGASDDKFIEEHARAYRLREKLRGEMVRIFGQQIIEARGVSDDNG